MFIFGKITGFFFGLLLGGMFGAFIGVLIGHYFDLQLKRTMQELGGKFSATLEHTREEFFNITFEIMGYLSKIDGRVSEQEIHVARSIMNQLALDDAKRMDAMDAFSRGKQSDFILEPRLIELKKILARAAHLKQLFLEIQLNIAYAEGFISTAKQEVIEKICHTLNVPLFLLRILETRFKAEQNFHHSANTTPKEDLNDAFGILGVSKESDHKTVKKAYRKLMNEHHPDKLAAKGLPESMRPIAKEKTQKIQMAYETICKIKGWN
ncbi:MAG TPA: co-chaperone DjlA [Gammaproteobacteria bacterium]|nr:co-chaperone DjlA [Gammaproteobacteria bacterium]